MSQRFASDLTSTAAPELNPGKATQAKQRAGLHPTGAPNWAFDLNTIFLNTVWVAGNGAANIQRFWPLTAYTTRYEATIYNP